MRRDLIVVILFFAIAATFVIGGQGVPLTGMIVASNGTNYDVEFCVREGYSNSSGTSYDFVGSIGCPLGFGAADFSMSAVPQKGVVAKGESRLVNVTLLPVDQSGSATLSASGAPYGANVSFSPASCSTPCYSNATVYTNSSIAEGSYNITLSGSSGTFVGQQVYNLTVLPGGVPLTCGAPATCDYGETQANCASDCFTTATMPGTVAPGELVTVTVEFRDFRYVANQRLKIDLKIDGTDIWDNSNGCFFGGKTLGPSGSDGSTPWPFGTVSEDGHFRISTSCTMPGTISAGAHTLVATPTIF